MANSVFQQKRTSISGRAANSTTLPNPGQIAINMADGIMYSTNGTFVFEIGANNTNVNVTGNATINRIISNGSLGTAGLAYISGGATSNAAWGILDIIGGGSGANTAHTAMANLDDWTNVSSTNSSIVLSNTSPRNYHITGSGSQQPILLPDATTLKTGYAYSFVNASDWNVLVRTSANAALVTMSAQQTAKFVCVNSAINNTTSWRSVLDGATASVGVGALVYATSPIFSGTVTLAASSLSANGTLGTAGQVLTSNGTTTSWQTPTGGGGSVNSAAQYTWTNSHVFSNSVTFNSTIFVANSAGINANGQLGTAGQILSSNGTSVYWASAGAASVNSAAQFTWTNSHNYSVGVFPTANGVPAGNSTARWSVWASNGNFTGNVGMGTTSQTDTRLQINTTVTNDFNTWNEFSSLVDANASITAARNKYTAQFQLYNSSQNKNVDGVTTYLTNYRALVADVFNGSFGVGGDAFGEEVTAGKFSAYQYANGVNANGVTTLSGTRNHAYQYGSGVISNAYGSLNLVYVGNNTVTGNISFAVGVYSQITSNTASTIASGYLFYGDHNGSTTTTKYGVYLNNEANNWMSGSLYTGGNVFIGAQTVFATSSHANSTGHYPSSNTVGNALGSTTRRWALTATTSEFRGGNVAIGNVPSSDTKFYIGVTNTIDADAWSSYTGTTDSNSSMTAARTKYGFQSSFVNQNQNKNVDGFTTYSATCRAVSGDIYNGSSSTGGDAQVGSLIAGSFRAYQYANGVNANSVTTLIGSRNQAFDYGSGVVTSAYGTLSEVWVANSTITGNIGTAYGVWSGITSNTAQNIGTGYLYYGQHWGTTTTTKYGVYLVNEGQNYFSGNVGIGVTSPSYKLHVNGSFAATTKSFVIDHPTKNDMFLRHGSLEGPENGVYVRGKLNYDKKIYLPDYWRGLVDEDSITVNLTASNFKQDGVYVENVNIDWIELNKTFTGYYTVFAERIDVQKLEVEFEK